MSITLPIKKMAEKLSGKELVLLDEAINQFFLFGTLSAENAENLKSIQKIILYEEGKELTLDEVITRILQFYQNFLPFT